MTNLQFPSAFVWGTATSSYQIEGAVHEDGRGESIWDRFSHTPGKIQDGSTGDVACDHYHRWREDIALMKELGMGAYRFSIAWPRILPQGRGQVNQPGLDFYSRLVDGLLEAGITPFATLYHWDLPQTLQDQGGWPARGTAEAFVEYADVVSRALGDRVKRWITHNEPWCVSMLSYQIGEHAPGIHNDWPAALAAAHNVLLSHGWAVPVLRRNSEGAEVGITLNFTPATPASSSEEDVAASRFFDGFFNRWFVDPLYRGAYPDDMIAAYTAQGHMAGGPAFVHSRDMEAISVPIDFLGVNYYTRAVIGKDSLESGLESSEQPAGTTPAERTEMGWEVYPQGLYDLLVRLQTDYNPGKLYITENGASYSDGPAEDGKVHDERRMRYLRDHFMVARRAIDAGVPLAGYFVWSLMDNFEWAKGYTQRFGIVWTDYATLQRLPKESALWYRQVIADNAVETEI